MARNNNKRHCVRCGRISRNQIIIPDGFKQSGKTICKKCENEIIDFLLYSEIPDETDGQTKESEE